MPLAKHLSPTLGITCGRREREAGRSTFRPPKEGGASAATATVEGTSVHQTSAAFAGCRKNVSLGRFTCPKGILFPVGLAHR